MASNHTDVEADRWYDRKVASIERERRRNGLTSNLPAFAAPAPTDDEIAAWRQEFPDLAPDDTCVWNNDETEPEPVGPHQYAPGLCGARLHRMTSENTRQPSGQCRKCESTRRKRKRAAVTGRPLCWQAKHPQPDEGHICPCGELPPPTDFLDWAAVERVLRGGSPGRPLTNAETLCAIVTYQRRNFSHLESEAVASILNRLTPNDVADFSIKRVKYVLYRWVHDAPITVEEALFVEMTTAAPDESETAVA